MNDIVNNIVIGLVVVFTIISMYRFRDLLTFIIPLSFLGYFFKINLGGLPLALPEIFTLVAFLYLFIFERGSLLRSLQYMYRVRWPLVLVVLGSFFGILVTMMTNGEMTLTLGAFKGWIIMPILFLIVFTSEVLNFKKTWENFSLIISIYSLGIIIAGFLGYGLEEYFGRLLGPYANANYLAMIVTPVLCGNLLKLISLGFRKNDTWYKGKESSIWNKDAYFLIFEIAVLGITLLWSQSYGAILASIGSVVVTSFIFFPNKRSWVVLYSILGILVTILIFSDSPKLKNLFVLNEQSSSSARVQIWTVAKELTLENGVLGIGIRQFENRFNKEAPEILSVEPYEAKVPHPHNQYFDFILSYGILGFIGFVWLFYILFEKSLKFSSPIMFCVLLVLVFHGIFDTWYSKIDTVFFFWFYTGIILLLRHPGNILPRTIVSKLIFSETIIYK